MWNKVRFEIISNALASSIWFQEVECLLAILGGYGEWSSMHHRAKFQDSVNKLCIPRRCATRIYLRVSDLSLMVCGLLCKLGVLL